MKNLHDLKIILTIGMVVMSLLTNILPILLRVSFGGGAMMCFIIVDAVFLFEALYCKLLGVE